MYNYIATIKKRVFGKSKLNLADLITWCEKNSHLPDNEMLDQHFVAAYESILPYDDMNDLPANFAKNDLFRFYVTTRRLILFSGNAKVVLQTDGTYKLMWQGYPVLFIGTSDAQRSFFPFGMAVTSHERSADFQFIFESLQKARKFFILISN